MDSDRGLRVRKAVIGFVALLLIAQFARTMAADLLPADPTPTQTPAPSIAPSDIPTSSPTDLASPTPSNTASSMPTLAPTSPAPSASTTLTPTDSPSPSPSSSPTHLPPHVIADQSMTIRVPSVVDVDPRAHSIYLPQMQVSGPTNLLVCVSGTQIVFDVAGQNQTDPTKGTLISGDQTGVLRASGVGASAILAINGQNGLRAISINGGIAAHVVHLSFVAISEPSLDPALCGAGSPSNNRTISIQGIGLNVDMLKGDVTLKK